MVELHPDLIVLRTLYEQLPPPGLRWKTDRGKAFLLELAVHADPDRHGSRRCAEAIGVSASAIYRMLVVTIPRKVLPWPPESDLVDLRKAWASVQAKRAQRIPVTATSPEFHLMHRALLALDARYDLRFLASALGIETDRLRRYTNPPLSSRRPGRAHERTSHERRTP